MDALISILKLQHLKQFNELTTTKDKRISQRINVFYVRMNCVDY